VIDYIDNLIVIDDFATELGNLQPAPLCAEPRFWWL